MDTFNTVNFDHSLSVQVDYWHNVNGMSIVIVLQSGTAHTLVEKSLHQTKCGVGRILGMCHLAVVFVGKMYAPGISRDLGHISDAIAFF